MSFHVSAVGSRDECIAQLRAAYIGDRQPIGDQARNLLADILQTEPDEAEPTGPVGYHRRYVVECSGRQGNGAPMSLAIKVEAHYVPRTPRAETALADQAAGPSRM